MKKLYMTPETAICILNDEDILTASLTVALGEVPEIGEDKDFILFG